MRHALQASRMARTVARGNAVMNFTNRYFDLVKDGDPKDMLGDPKWDYQYWSLHATEFYFFDHGMLPTFMYSLWMIELAALYIGPGGQLIRDSHSDHLRRYSASYSQMLEFFNDLYEEARRYSDHNLRNKAVAKLVGHWSSKSPTITLE